MGRSDFFPKRDGTDVEISLINPDLDYDNVVIYRAEKNNYNFTEIAKVAIGSFPYNDTVPDATKDYKYKLMYESPGSEEIWDETTEIWDQTTEFWTEVSKRTISKFTTE